MVVCFFPARWYAWVCRVDGELDLTGVIVLSVYNEVRGGQGIESMFKGMIIMTGHRI